MHLPTAWRAALGAVLLVFGEYAAALAQVTSPKTLFTRGVIAIPSNLPSPIPFPAQQQQVYEIPPSLPTFVPLLPRTGRSGSGVSVSRQSLATQTRSVASPSLTDATACSRSQPSGAEQKMCELILDYNTALFAHNKALLLIQERQYDSELGDGPIIFVIVLVIVAIGLVLSILQFIKGFLFAKSAQTDTTEFSFTPAAGFEIKSSVLGLALLAISLGFFFLYLKFVYSINPVNTN